MTESLGLTDELAALFFVVPSLVAFSSSMLIERYIDRLGAVLILRVGLGLMGVAFLLFSLTPDYHLILLETTMFGFGFGLVSVAQNVAVTLSSNDPGLQRQLFSGLHAMYALASLFSPLLAGYLFSEGMGWSQILLVSSFVPGCVLLATAWFRFPPLMNRSRGSSLKQDNETSYVSFRADPSGQGKFENPPGLSLQASSPGSVNSAGGHSALALPKKHAYFFSVSMSVYLIAEISVSSRLVVHARRLLDISDAEATGYLTVFFVCLLSGRLLFALYDFARFKTHHLMQFCLLSSGVLYGAGLIWTPWLLAISGFFMAPFFPLVMDYAVRVFHEQSPRVIALCMAFASLSVVFMHYGLGAASDKYGLDVALWIGPFALFSCLVLFMLERRLFHQGEQVD